MKRLPLGVILYGRAADYPGTCSCTATRNEQIKRLPRYSEWQFPYRRAPSQRPLRHRHPPLLEFLGLETLPEWAHTETDTDTQRAA